MRIRKTSSLFLIGLTVHSLFVLIILFTQNRLSAFFQKDTGQITEVVTAFSFDSKSYIESADNYLTWGVFGKGSMVDYHRTIGYPFVIFFFKLIFRGYWHFGLITFQIVVGSLIYPLVFRLGRIVFQAEEKILTWSVVVLLFLGAYFTKSIYVLTDLIFTFFFLLGVYLSVIAVAKKSNAALMLPALVALAISGLIRPVLLFYPIAHLLILSSVAITRGTWRSKQTKVLIVGSSLMVIVACNYSTYRIYRYHHVFVPTDVLGINLFDYSVKNILTRSGKQDEYNRMKMAVDTAANWVEKDKLRRSFFYHAVKENPTAAISYWTNAFKTHLLGPHFIEIGSVYGAYKEDVNGVLRKSLLMQIVFYAFTVVNILIGILFFGYLFQRLFMREQFLTTLAVVSVIAVVVGPSLLAATGSRMRIPIEPFMVIPAVSFFSELLNRVKNPSIKPLEKKEAQTEPH